MADKESELESSTSSRKLSANGPFKVILLGVSGVGKSSIFHRIKYGNFCEDVRGQQFDTFMKTISISNDKTVQMKLFDTAGMESYHERSITRSYYLGSRVVLIVYSADDMNSVDDLEVYIKDVNTHAPSAKKILIRNKIDLEDQSVNEDEVDAKLKKWGHFFHSKHSHQISAKTGKGVESLLKEIGVVLLKRAQSITAEQVVTIKAYRQQDSDRRHQQESSPCC